MTMRIPGLKTKCIFCRGKILNYSIFSSKSKGRLYLQWIKECARKLCVLLNLHKSCSKWFENAGFCGECHQLICDVDFLQCAVQKLQQRLNKTTAKIEGLLRTNFLQTVSEEWERNPQESTSAYNQAVKLIGVQFKPIEPKEEILSSPVDTVVNNSSQIFELTPTTTIAYNCNETPKTGIHTRTKQGVGNIVNRRKRKYNSMSLITNDQTCRNESEIHKDENVEYLYTGDDADAGDGSCSSDYEPSQEKTKKNSKARKLDVENTKSKNKKRKDGESKVCSKKPRVKMSKACPHCDHRYHKEYMLQSHIRQVHENDPVPFGCPECEARFDTIWKARKHYERAHKEPNIKCPHCPRMFHGMAAVRQHSSYVHTDLQLKPKCKVCHKILNLEEVGPHEATHISISDDPLFSYCVLCPLTFPTHFELRDHVRDTHEENLFKCEQCGLKFITKNRLRNHIKIHHKRTQKPELTCTQCGYSTHAPCVLRMHMLSHSSERKFVCDREGCTRSYKHKSALAGHIRHAHDKILSKNSEDYMCKQCDKVFPFKEAYTSHMRHHSNARVFMCDKCSRSYKTKQNLRTHYKVHKESKTTGTNLKLQEPRKGRLTAYKVKSMQQKNLSQNSVEEKLDDILMDTKFRIMESSSEPKLPESMLILQPITVQEFLMECDTDASVEKVICEHE